MSKYLLKYRFIGLVIVFTIFQLKSQDIYDTKYYKLNVKTIASELNHPWAMVFLSDKTYLISERNGDLIYFESGKKSSIKFPDNVLKWGQGGILDLALHPNHIDNGWIYVTYSKAKKPKVRSGATALARFKLKNKKIVNWQQLYVTSVWSGSGRHFGSRIVFDNENNIYFSSGDRGMRHEAQSLKNELGTVLRLTDKGKIPKDNFHKAIYSYGHRNIQGMYFYNNTIFSHEHGPQGGDELNIIKKGKNYGWPIITYGKEYGSGKDIGEGTYRKGIEPPITYWSPSIAPSGMSVYQGDIFDKWEGDILLGALKDRMLVRIKLDDKYNVIEQEKIAKEIGRIRSVYVRKGKVFLLTDSGDGDLLVIDRV